MLHFVSDLQKSQVTKSLRSPHRVLEGLHVDSLKSPLIMRIISGVSKDSLWTPYKVLGESLGSPWGLHYIRISPHGLLGDSLWTPIVLGDSLGLLEDSLGTP